MIGKADVRILHVEDFLETTLTFTNSRLHVEDGRPLMAADSTVRKPEDLLVKLRSSSAFLAIMFMTTVALAAGDSTAPTVVATTPEGGSTDVDPAITELRVTFDEPMSAGSWSWAYENKEDFPKITGPPRYLEDQKTAVLPVKLQPNRQYTIWINTSRFQNFKDQSGNPAVPFRLSFETTSAKDSD